MRHLGSLLTAIVLGAVAYVLAGVGIIRLETAFVKQNPQYNPLLFAGSSGGGSMNWTDFGYGAGGLIIAGILIAVLVLTPLSPVGPIVAGLVYIGAELWFLEDPHGITKVLGSSVFGNHAAAEAPLTGLAFVVAIPLIATAVLPHRWHGKPAEALGVTSDSSIPPLYQPTYGDTTGSTELPAYGTEQSPFESTAAQSLGDATGDTRTEE